MPEFRSQTRLAVYNKKLDLLCVLNHSILIYEYIVMIVPKKNFFSMAWPKFSRVYSVHNLPGNLPDLSDLELPKVSDN